MRSTVIQLLENYLGLIESQYQEMYVVVGVVNKLKGAVEIMVYITKQVGQTYDGNWICVAVTHWYDEVIETDCIGIYDTIQECDEAFAEYMVEYQKQLYRDSLPPEEQEQALLKEIFSQDLA